MKATELRIGNYINTINRDNKVHIPNDIVFVLQEIGFDCIVCDIDLNPATQRTLPVFNHYDLSPIVLADEWLLKLNVPESFLSKDIGGYFIWFNGEKIYIKYVHELQNLYFALRGNELLSK